MPSRVRKALLRSAYTHLHGVVSSSSPDPAQLTEEQCDSILQQLSGDMQHCMQST